MYTECVLTLGTVFLVGWVVPVSDLVWVDAHIFFEEGGKAAVWLVANGESDILDTEMGRFQKLLGHTHTPALGVLSDGHIVF